MRWNTVRLVDAHGKPFDLIGWLQQLTPTIETHEQAVWVQSVADRCPRPIRLIARRKTPEAIVAAHNLLRQHANRRACRTHAASSRRNWGFVLDPHKRAEPF